MDLYSAFIVVPHTQGAQVRITQCYLQITPYLSLPHKHSPDGASPEWGCGHLIAAYYSVSTPKEWKAESAWLADLQRTVYPHKWSSVSRRSSAGQWNFACQRPTFYHCATQPTCGSRINFPLSLTLRDRAFYDIREFFVAAARRFVSPRLGHSLW